MNVTRGTRPGKNDPRIVSNRTDGRTGPSTTSFEVVCASMVECLANGSRGDGRLSIGLFGRRSQLFGSQTELDTQIIHVLARYHGTRAPQPRLRESLAAAIEIRIILLARLLLPSHRGITIPWNLSIPYFHRCLGSLKQQFDWSRDG